MSLAQRVSLHKKLPLETPFSVHIFPVHLCNFKCKYCLHSLSNKELKAKGFKKEIMSFETYKKAIDDIAQYENKLKALIFAGHGEPLLHPNICEMVKYAKDNKISNRIEITTNASLLTPEMSDRLIDAGIDRLKISIQGTTEKKYKEVSNFNLDYDKFLSNLKYFYDNKTHTEVYIKIIDIALNDKNDTKKFKEMFIQVADYVNIEYAIPFINELNESAYNNKEFYKCKQGNLEKSQICSMPFYMQVIAPNGDVLPCCSSDIPIILGNVHKNSLKLIWNGKIQNNFLKMMLKDKNKNPVCRVCCVPEYGLQKGDYLDKYKEKLLEKYNEMYNESKD